MNCYIHEKELNEVKAALVRWKDNLPPDVAEYEFYTLAKRVCNLEKQNLENAKRLLSDFSIGEISFYLIDNKMADAVIFVDDNQNYEVKCFNDEPDFQVERDLYPTSHVRGKGTKHIIVI